MRGTVMQLLVSGSLPVGGHGAVSSPGGRVYVVCVTCQQERLISTSPMARLRELLGAFFAEHAACEMTIGVSAARGLRLLPAAY